MPTWRGTRPPTIGISPATARHTKMPTRVLLSSIFAPSHRACGPKIRLMPENGLSRDHFGFSAFVAKNRPPCAIAATTPTTSTITPIVSDSRNAMRAPIFSTVNMSRVSGDAVIASVVTSRSWICCMPRLVSHRMVIAIISTADQAPRSWVRATWPSLRLCLSFFGVAFSVFSSATAHPLARDLHGRHRLREHLEQALQRVGQHREGQADDEQRQADL